MATTTQQQRRRILFVDDDAAFLEMIEHVMQVWSKGSWEIHLAQNTGKALSIIQENPIDLVVIDVQMPVVDGLQFLTLLKRKYPNLQKAVLTGYANDTYRAACLSNGAELFLEKPTNLEGLETVFSALNEISAWKPEEGFRGVLRRVGLQEVLQMECLSRNSSVLEVTAGDERGEIFIQDGTIIHAQVGSRTGETAFNRLLALKGGEFHLKPFEGPPEKTIEGSWEFLLMEAARLRDEVGPEPDVEPEPEPADLPSKSIIESTPVAPLQPKREQPVPAELKQPAAGGESPRTPVAPITDTATQPRVAAAPTVEASDMDLFPTRIDEVMICSVEGEVLYEWQCRNSELWINLLEFVSQKSRQLGEGLALGPFNRLEVEAPKSRIVAQITSAHGILVRASKTAPDLAAARAA